MAKATYQTGEQLDHDDFNEVAAATNALYVDGSVPLGALPPVNVTATNNGSGTSNPTAATIVNGAQVGDILPGNSKTWKNTSNGEVRHWYNDGGTMKSSSAFS